MYNGMKSGSGEFPGEIKGKRGRVSKWEPLKNLIDNADWGVEFWIVLTPDTTEPGSGKKLAELAANAAYDHAVAEGFQVSCQPRETMDGDAVVFITKTKTKLGKLSEYYESGPEPFTDREEGSLE